MGDDQMLKILILEDVVDDVGLIKRELTKAGIIFELKRVDTKTEFVEALRHYHAHVILSDHSLPQFNSIDALKLCKRAGLNVPFILVTGTVSEEFAVQCLKQGADDYVLKSNLTRLSTAIRNSLRQKELEFERKKTERTLRRQNEELVKINKELDSFVYSVSHNLRAPLMSVLGLLNLAQRMDEAGDHIFEAYFSMMEKSIHKLDLTLKEILDYSRNARHQLQLKEVDIREVLEDSISRLQYMAGSDQLVKRITLNQEGPLYSDAYRLQVIFNNLLSNTIKYRDMQKEQSSLDISVAVDARHLHLVFQDNGIGIAPELLPRIFDMFFRGTELSEGAGLGLYIVQETIEKLHGKISMTSQLGVGTMIQIEIPNYLPPPQARENSDPTRDQ